MLSILTLPVGQLKTNCYIISDQKSKEAIIIDPGDDADFIIQKISDLNLKPKAMLATHCHFDHILAVQELKLAFKIPLLASQKDEFLLRRMRKSALHFTKVDPGPAPKIDKYLDTENSLRISETWPFRLGNCKLKIIAVPGHTPGSVCFHFTKIAVEAAAERLVFPEGETRRSEELPSRDFLFVGDFNEYHSQKDKPEVQKSINKILKLPKETVIFPGHGESMTMNKLQSRF